MLNEQDIEFSPELSRLLSRYSSALSNELIYGEGENASMKRCREYAEKTQAAREALVSGINAEITRLRAAAEAPVVASGWKLACEVMPTPGARVLTFGAKRTGMAVMRNTVEEGWEIETACAWNSAYTPTHWMLLPAEPGAAPASPAAPVAQSADELIRGFDRSLASVDAHDPQSFIDGAKWAEQRICAATPAAPLSQQSEPVAWIRLRSDGGYEGPIMDASMEDVRKRSGAWTPLYAGSAPASPVPELTVEMSRFLTDVVTAAGLLAHGKRDKALASRISAFAFDLRTGAAPAGPVPAAVLDKLLRQIEGAKRRMRHTPATGQNHSHYLCEDIDCFVEEARASLAAPASTGPCSDDTAKDENALFEEWAKNVGIIQESHGIRSIASVCSVAQNAWDARAALSAAEQAEVKP